MINYSIVVMGTTPGTKKENIQETKAYGTAQCSEVLDINKFAEHITSTIRSMTCSETNERKTKKKLNCY